MEFLKKIILPKQKISNLPQPLVVRELFEIFDVFYICFDEPNRHANWRQISKYIPRAKKIEGVVGFDNALKTCAKKSQSSYFFVIDGDNQVRPDCLDQKLEILDIQDDWVLSWASFNPLNALAYGNGGLKLWPKKVALNINSHENANGQGDQTDYCFVAKYFLVDQYVTETLINTTYEQAFRAGFREGVKMSLVWGEQVELNSQNFSEILGRQNQKRLRIWCEVGADVHHGRWAILGARMGLYYNAVLKFQCSHINSYQWISDVLQSEVLEKLLLDPSNIEKFDFNNKELIPLIEHYGELLEEKLGVEYKILTTIESLEFKRNFVNPRRRGLIKANKDS